MPTPNPFRYNLPHLPVIFHTCPFVIRDCLLFCCSFFSVVVTWSAFRPQSNHNPSLFLLFFFLLASSCACERVLLLSLLLPLISHAHAFSFCFCPISLSPFLSLPFLLSLSSLFFFSLLNSCSHLPSLSRSALLGLLPRDSACVCVCACVCACAVVVDGGACTTRRKEQATGAQNRSRPQRSCAWLLARRLNNQHKPSQHEQPLVQ